MGKRKFALKLANSLLKDVTEKDKELRREAAARALHAALLAKGWVIPFTASTYEELKNVSPRHFEILQEMVMETCEAFIEAGGAV